jgi:hypothetical protein
MWQQDTGMLFLLCVDSGGFCVLPWVGVLQVTPV